MPDASAGRGKAPSTSKTASSRDRNLFFIFMFSSRCSELGCGIRPGSGSVAARLWQKEEKFRKLFENGGNAVFFHNTGYKNKGASICMTNRCTRVCAFLLFLICRNI
jgi:hypothetical protein